ncbi:hypothetical protein ES707_16963 [subsurface metagenome]
MTKKQIEKMRNYLTAIMEQVRMISHYGVLLEQRKKGLEEIEAQVLQIRNILKDEKKRVEKKSG